MFGWLRKRMERELRKLAFQTFKASTDSSMLFLCAGKGGLDVEHVYGEFELASVELIYCLERKEKPSLDLRERCFAANKKLRHFYDQFGLAGGQPFDQNYRPLGGWDMYFEMNSSEVHLIKQMEEIKRLVEAQHSQIAEL